MQFELPDLTPLIVMIVAVIAVTTALLVAVAGTGAVTFFARNRRVRVARHEPLGRYYGHLLLGH